MKKNPPERSGSHALFPVIRARYSPLLAACCLLCAACSFDYGNQEGADSNQPDIVMDDVEYVRVRSGDPVARFRAESARRFEKRQLMELRNLTFEQFEKQSGDINAYGEAGSAEVSIDSGDIKMDSGVRIEVESEDITIETRQLEWKDRERTLEGGGGEAVNILRKNGTSFSGIGFTANARERTWEFASTVDGMYIHDDDEEAEAGGADSESVDSESASGESAGGESADSEAAAAGEAGDL